MTLLNLFWSILQVGLFSIGGGYAAMPLIQAQVVERNAYLTMAEFADLVTIAEMTPGPIAIYAATFVGIRIAGVPGALIATLGSILPSCVIASVLSRVYARYRSVPALQDGLGCLRPAGVALVASAGLSLLGQALFGGAAASMKTLNVTALILFLAAFLALRRWRCSPILVMALCGAAGLAAGLLFG